jgi:pyruvate/2-oxoglutarate dehydrogenase complex dihydrolipoamide dehydrogenase (E3) component
MKKLDAIVIGTGQAGPFLAARLAGSGMKVAIIERKLFGGTCVNTGCIPTKTLIASARTAYLARRATDFGIMISGTEKIMGTSVTYFYIFIALRRFTSNFSLIFSYIT